MANEFDLQYHHILSRILLEGVRKADRTGTGTLSVFGHMSRFDLSKGFPLITTKKIHLHSIIHELLWMLSGSSNIKYLKDNDVRIWNEWADENGDLGPVYGSQWRNWDGKVDQIAQIVETLKSDKPWSRRIMLSAWNVADVPNMKLPPCHFNAQFIVEPKDPVIGYARHVEAPHKDQVGEKLNCLMNIRSWDVFLGGPFNIAQYALLTMMLAQVSGLEVGELIVCSGDTHLYLNHLEQAQVQLARGPRSAPRMVIDPSVKSIDDFKYEHFSIEGYDPHPHIKGTVSV